MARLEPDVTLPWLVRLRWFVLAGQITALGVAAYLGLDLHWTPIAIAIGIGIAANVALEVIGRRQALAGARLMGLVLIVDIALLTVLLAASGGATNPFTVVFLVYITLSAVVLSARWTTLITILAVVAYGSLFLLDSDARDPHAGHMGHGTFGYHLEGMWVAFMLAAGLTGFFVRRISQAIAFQREQIATLRETNARNARLAALTTLAAGAAHELNSPLGTIAVSAHEAGLRLRQVPEAAAIVDDLRLIQLEVDRCQDILHRMTPRAAPTEDGPVMTTGAELAGRIATYLGDERAASTELHFPPELELHVPVEQLVQSVVALIRNAFEAGGTDDRVVVELTADSDEVKISVQDRGSGMAADVLARIGEPFFTTKQPGRGMGLGVFLARTFLESHGGGLAIESTPGIGTRAVVRLPVGGPRAMPVST